MLGETTFTHVVRDERAGLMARDPRAARTSEAGDLRHHGGRRSHPPRRSARAEHRRRSISACRPNASARRRNSARRARSAPQEIRSRADRDGTVIVAEATSQSEQIRGEGDGDRNRIFAEAFGKDPEFFAFYRSMQAYETGLKSSDTRLLLKPDSEFFRFFGDPSGKAPAAAPRTPVTKLCQPA